MMPDQENNFTLIGNMKQSLPNTTTITVITCTFNAVQYLQDTIKSIMAQKDSNIEWIVIDGGSTDGTIEIIKKHEKDIDYWISEPDKGIYDAIAKGFNRAHGGIVCWLNAGDIFMPGALSLVSELFDKNPNVNWMTGMQFTHLPGGKIVSCFLPALYSRDLIKCGAYVEKLPVIQQESTFFRNTMLSYVDMEIFRNFKVAGDFYLWHSFAKKERLVVVCAAFGSFCIHEGQLSENHALYRQEVFTFLEPLTLTTWFKIKLHFPLRYLPRRLKKLVAGIDMLVWEKSRGWG
ncbi:MAG: glycosyltransferase [Methylobacter sp.]|nr:glycosyltransferase [Methylobacter sp.]